jgi:heavy metal translocating P-type ATPase
MSVQRAQKGLKQLISLAPALGRIVRNGIEDMVPISQIHPGDTLRILPGETIPVDGVVLANSTTIDQSVISGESLPVDKTVGDPVYCGSINCFGSVDIEATAVGEDSTLQKLIQLVREAEQNKAPLQRIVDKWAAWLVPIVLVIALVAWLLTQDVVRAVTILVVFCPCALVLATPVSIVAAIGQATKHGVIIKSGDALEQMGKADCLAFDKTGTLTAGNTTVSDILPNDNASRDGLLQLAASAETYSEHPLAKAIVAAAADRGLPQLISKGFVMIPGKGVESTVDNKQVLCGNYDWLAERGVVINPGFNLKLDRLRYEGKATVLVSSEGEFCGVIALSDTLRQPVPNTIHELHQIGAETVLLTGDHQQSADYFALLAGIRSVHAGLQPADKVAMIKRLQSNGRIVCMVGDGVNDAPALKTANVGVAMGSLGSDIAIEASDIALMSDDITKVSYIKRLSNATVRLIMLNISLSMVINVLAVAFAMLGFLEPVSAALVHNVGSVIVVLNAAFLYDRDFG